MAPDWETLKVLDGQTYPVWDKSEYLKMEPNHKYSLKPFSDSHV